MSSIPPDQPIRFLPRWCISDTHFGHANIVRYAGRPADHEQRIRAAWSEMVAPGDTLLHLGDLCLCPRERMEEIAERLPGRKWLIKGNHDRHGRAWFASLGFRVVAPFCLLFEGWSLHFTHAPAPELVRAPRSLNLHGHIHQRTMGDRRLVNLSVEQTGYAPVGLEQLVRARIAELEGRAEPG